MTDDKWINDDDGERWYLTEDQLNDPFIITRVSDGSDYRFRLDWQSGDVTDRTATFDTLDGAKVAYLMHLSLWRAE